MSKMFTNHKLEVTTHRHEVRNMFQRTHLEHTDDHHRSSRQHSKGITLQKVSSCDSVFHYRSNTTRNPIHPDRYRGLYCHTGKFHKLLKTLFLFFTSRRRLGKSLERSDILCIRRL